MSVLHIHDRPALRQPILLAAFGGWGDAGAAATGALGFLLGDPLPSPVASFDPERCFDFTVERPITRRGPDGRWQLDYPVIGFYRLELPGNRRDLLILRGPEPHTAWPTLARTAAAFAGECGVDLGLTLGAFIGPVSHRATALLRRTSNPELDKRLASRGVMDTPYAGPTAFASAMLHALDEAGIAAASIWGAAPAYLGPPNPAVSLALLEAVEGVAEITLDLGRLRGIATDFVRRIEAALRENPEVASRLGQLIDLGEPASTEPEGPPDLPAGRDLVEELERFLRESRGDADPP